MIQLDRIVIAFDVLRNLARKEDDYLSMVPTRLIDELALEIDKIRATPKDYAVQQFIDDQYILYGEYETFEEAERIARTLEYGTARIYIKSLGIYTKGVIWNA